MPRRDLRAVLRIAASDGGKLRNAESREGTMVFLYPVGLLQDEDAVGPDPMYRHKFMRRH